MAKKRRGKAKSAKRGRTRFLIVEARFYDKISDMLMRGATRALDEADAEYVTVTVPGALEIPAAIAMCVDAARTPYDGVVALGCVIRGDTYHFEIVSNESARALMDLSVSRKLPVGNGILTVDNESQAETRASVEEGNKGGDAARAALTMARLKRDLGVR